MNAILTYWQVVVSWWDAVVAFGGLVVVILFGYWAIAWAYRFTQDEDRRADDLADFAAMELSKDERHAVAEILQVRMVR